MTSRCPRCAGNLFFDDEDTRNPEYHCLQCGKSIPIAKPNVPLIDPELLKVGHRKRTPRDFRQQLRWNR